MYLLSLQTTPATLISDLNMFKSCFIWKSQSKRLLHVWLSWLLWIFLPKVETHCLYKNGTFEPVQEIWKIFWSKAFFWINMKMTIKKKSITCPRFHQIQDLRRKKYKKGIFKKSNRENWKIIFVLGSYESLEHLEG